MVEVEMQLALFLQRIPGLEELRYHDGAPFADAETRAVPEFLGSDCEPGPMSQALFCLLEHPEDRANQVAAMNLTMERLGGGGEAPGLRAARSVLGALSSAPRPR